MSVRAEHWFKKPWQKAAHRRWHRAVAACLDTVPRYFPAIHPDRHIPYVEIRRLVSELAGSVSRFDHPSNLSLPALVREDGDVEALVPVRAISGIGNVNGDYAFNLARLPEGMGLRLAGAFGPAETFGPLDHAEMQRLWEAVRRELGGFDEDDRIRLAHQSWDNCYIVRNSAGAAHRFALWWRLQHHVSLSPKVPGPVRALPARVACYHLDPAAFNYLRHSGRVLFCVHDPAIAAAFLALHELEPDILYVAPTDTRGDGRARRPAAILIPQLGANSGRRSADIVALHRWADHLFDLGRYLTERATTYLHGRDRPAAYEADGSPPAGVTELLPNLVRL